MNRPPNSAPFDTSAGHTTLPNTAPNPPPHSYNPPPYESISPDRSAYYQDRSAPHYHHTTPVYGAAHRASHLHLPGVATYIEHYHYYNFNGNCTVQQASGDGQPNTIHMVSSSVRPPPHQHTAPRVDIPPVPPPVRDPLARHRPGPPDYAAYPPDPPAPPPPPLDHDHDKRRSDPPAAHYSSLPLTHLAPLTGPSRPSLPPSTDAIPRQSPFLAGPRLGKPPPSATDSRPVPAQTGSLLPRLRGAMDADAPILAPLQSGLHSTLSPLHTGEDKLAQARPNKRTRLSRSISIPMPTHDAHRAQGAAVGAGGVAGTAGGGSDSNCASASDDRAVGITTRGTQQPAYGIDRMAHTANSSSPSHGEYPLQPRTDGYEISSSAVGGVRPARNVEESQSNDWEAVVEMYRTGKGTEDGVALKMITKGDGRRVSDRKLLEKRRTIGKTYECLGAARFEAAIGYKWENGVRRKQKMYHVISRCRVVNAMRKAGEQIPTDFQKLTDLIDKRIAEKEALKEAGKTGANRRPGMTLPGAGGIATAGQGGDGATGLNFPMEGMSRLRGVRPGGREGRGVHGEAGTPRGAGSENEGGDTVGGRLSGGNGSAQVGDASSAPRDEEDEIKPGRARDRGRFA